MVSKAAKIIAGVKKGFHRRFHELDLGNRVPLYWWRGEQNWGDALNPVLARFLSEKEVKFTKIKYCEGYLAVGSVLSLANSNTVVWGSGFMSNVQTVKEKPSSVCAVRGPQTRAMLLDQGIDCPKIFGDPALLLPLFYNPPIDRKYRLGLIPHYRDAQHPWVQQLATQSGVLLIDVKGDIFEFVDAVKSCEFIVSSSLHGLICADAYGVPNIHIELSTQVSGGNFKFNDYAASVGKQLDVRIDHSVGDTPRSVVAEIKEIDINLDLKSLLLSCPFLSNNLRNKVNSVTSEQLCLSAIRKSLEASNILAHCQ